MKTLTLNIHKWRNGDTLLNNHHGYQCCLGQFCLQLGKTKEELSDFSDPEFLETTPSLLTESFNQKAIGINDDRLISIQERIKRLKSHCRKNKIKLRLVNDSARRRNGSINWKFIYNLVEDFIMDALYLQDGISRREFEKLNKYTREAIRAVGIKRFLKKIREQIPPEKTIWVGMFDEKNMREQFDKLTVEQSGTK
jgi:hypothetical protein